MTSSERYIEKAAKFAALAEEAEDPEIRASYIRMAQGYLRLAGHSKQSDVAERDRR